MLSIGLLVWSALKPVLKLFLILGLGFCMSKWKLATPQISKAISRILIQVGYPCLLFISVVVNISSANIEKLGIMTIACIFYILLGWGLGYAIARLLRPPKSFYHSCIMSTSMGNWGDLTLSVISSVTTSHPFNQGDAGVGIAYVACFLCFANLYFYTVGLPEIGRDFNTLENDPTPDINTPLNILENGMCDMNKPEPAVTHLEPAESLHTETKKNAIRVPVIEKRNKHLNIWLNVVTNPCNISVVAGLIIALIPQLKWLFYQGISTPSINNEPPLQFLTEVLQYVGNIAVPLGLLNLGAALGSLKLGTFLPNRIIASITVVRLLIIPAIGISFVYALTLAGILDSNDKVMIFVLMFQACVPTASSTVFFTQFWHPLGEADEIASVVLVQYLCSLLSLTGSLILILKLIE